MPLVATMYWSSAMALGAVTVQPCKIDAVCSTLLWHREGVVSAGMQLHRGVHTLQED
jgi:hypothetical protein